jgi:hypothetical protein
MSEHPPDQLINQIFNGTIAASSKSVLAARDRVFRVRHYAAIRAEHDCPVGDTVMPAALFRLFFKL